eukprot:m.71373 g.71373  ORF g.71373 m.71373 type:complete len:339 (-) comp12941_c0_seq1:28-1044(-)
MGGFLGDPKKRVRSKFLSFFKKNNTCSMEVTTLSKVAGLAGHLLARVPNLVLRDATADLSLLRTARIVLADPVLLAPHVSSLVQCEWVQSTWAGVDSLARVVTEPQRWTLTRFTGSFGQPMAEYVLGAIINHERHTHLYRKQQEARTWTQHPYRTLNNLTVGILGAGDIGSAVASTCAALGMTVHALVRTPRPTAPPIARIFQPSELSSLLSGVDYIVNILPSTPHTRGLLDGPALDVCTGRSPVLINVGRSDVASEATLLRALDRGLLAGAVLDVFATEPLPASSPLWTHPKVVITPHVAAVSFGPDVASLFAANLSRFHQEGAKGLRHVVNLAAGY